MNIPAEFMSLTSEAVVIVRGSVIVYANSAAQEYLGSVCTGRSVREVFGAEIDSVQASSYSASAVLNGRSFILRSGIIDGMKLILFSPTDNPGTVLNSTFLSAINSTLMNLTVTAENGISIAERLNNAELLNCFASVNKIYYKLKRLSSNVTTAENFFSRTLPFFPMPYDVSKLVYSYINAGRSLSPKIDFRTNLPESLIVNFDRQLVFSALSNLISNCIVHAENCSLVSVSVTESSTAVLISVTDNGCGIPPEVLSGVFSRYRFVDALSSCSGAGLGMTVVRAAAELHGGTLLVESRENIGTTARFSLSKNTRRCSDTLGIVNETEDIGMQELYTSLPDILPPEVLI